MFILFFAAELSIWHGDYIDASVIIAIMFINALIFYVQTYSTSRVLRSLEKKSKQTVKVTRDKHEVTIPATDIVPGDIVSLAEGEKIPADGRLLSTQQLRVNEAQLTGESEPISKSPQPVHSESPIYERTSMLYQGSFIVSGTAQYVITATGNTTEFSSIAQLVKDQPNESPIQQKISKLITQIVIITSIGSVVMLGLALIRGIELVESLRFVMALLVSVVPEGLPVAISVVLVLGMRRMAKKRALVQTMRSIETIGAVTAIATDKTGTLTRNKLALEKIWKLPGGTVNIATIGIKTLTTNGLLNTLNDPLDIAISTYAQKNGASLPKQAPHTSLPFDQESAMSGNIWHRGSDFHFYAKGAPERIIARSRLTETEREKITQALHDFTSHGYRVIALAEAPLKKPFSSFETMPKQLKLQFKGLIAVADQLRPEAKTAISAAKRAGISVCMITGDHVETAYYIGKQLGMVTDREQVFDSRRLEVMSDEELEKHISNIGVFARVVPEQKYRILGILKRHNIAAMTGDGVNDVPALSNAHVGVGMGSGSHIAKDASDMILLDDNFKTIIDGVREGRTIIANVSRMLFYLLSTNLGEMLVMVAALIIGLPLPLVPLQILWVNLLTDTSMVVPLGLEPTSKNVMRSQPRSLDAPIIPRYLIYRMLLIASTIAVITLAVFVYYLQTVGLEYARTAAFNTLVVTQIASAFAARSHSMSAFKRLKVFSLPFYIGLGLALVTHLVVLLTPVGDLLHVGHISLTDLAITSTIAFILPLAVSEIHKLSRR